MTRIPTIRVRVPRNAEVRHRGTLSIDDWSVPCVVGSNGLAPPSVKREGDRCTPIGVFPLRYGMYDPKALPDFPRDLAFPFVPQAEDMILEESGPDYNRMVYAEGDERRESRLMRERPEPLFEIVVPIGYNDAVVEPGRGSQLLVHAARADMSGSAGCVSIARDQMMELVRRLRPGMMIDIAEDAEEIARPAVTASPGPIEMVRFVGLEPGPKLLVTGAVHGNESCGPAAIRRAIAECREGRLTIRRGQVTFIPILNLKAWRQNTREGDRNLNRTLYERPIPDIYEDRIANLFCPILREHDALLDIHSFRSGKEPFIFVGPSDNDGEIEPFRQAEAEGAFAARLGQKMLIHGWLTAYARAAKERERLGGGRESLLEGVGTTEYMRFAGGYGVTLECGEHEDPRGPDIGYAAIVNALSHLRLIDGAPPASTVERSIEIVDVVLAHSAEDRLSAAWMTGDAVTAGQTIARRADGTDLTAPYDGFLVFPNATPQRLDVLYYLGKASDRRFA